MRKRLAATVMAAVFAGGAFLTAGTASASTVLAEGCIGAVVGNMGDQIAVQGKDVSDIVKTAAKEQEVLLHLNKVDPDQLARTITEKGALTVGLVPNAANGTVTGDEVATVVTQALQNTDGLGWSKDQQQKTTDAIAKKVAGTCGLTTYAGNYTPPTSLPSTQPDGTTTAPGTTVPTYPGLVSMGTGNATAPPRDYGNIPAAVPGIAIPPGTKYPSGAPLPTGQTPPEIGVLSGGSTAGQTDVRNAGNANALAAEPAANTVQLPMLLAVVALAGVSAALVRTWVLRKVS